MSAVISLGKFERVPLTKAWPTEDGNFTPWLAGESVIGLLGEALGMELEVEAVEHWVGSFRADILARATEEADHRVLIENQFGRTDHKHLGQILTYLAGIEGAKTIVWIAETIQSDHRAAIDWLNTYTADDFSFFAIEIELWRIDDSAPAPRFNVIASPNDWTRNITRATRAIDGGGTDERRSTYVAYWSDFTALLKERKEPLRALGQPPKDYGYWFGLGRPGVLLMARAGMRDDRLAVEVQFNNKLNSKVFYDLIHRDRAAIEADLGEPLGWHRQDDQVRARIEIVNTGFDLSNREQWRAQHEWLLEHLLSFRRAFHDRIRDLKVADGPAEPPGQLER